MNNTRGGGLVNVFPYAEPAPKAAPESRRHGERDDRYVRPLC